MCKLSAIIFPRHVPPFLPHNRSELLDCRSSSYRDVSYSPAKPITMASPPSPADLTLKSERLSLLATLTPPSLTRAWSTTPHPTLPIVATATGTTCRIYSLTSFTLLSTITGGHKKAIRACAWKPNSATTTLATASFDASVGIWSKSDDGADGDDDVAVDALLSDGGFGETQSGTLADDHADEQWHFAIVLDGHESEVKSLAWSAGGNLLATCSRDKSVWVWEEVAEEDYETVAVMQEHEGDVKCVAWAPEEEVLASGGYDDDVRIWREDALGGEDWGCVSVLKGHEGTVWSLSWEGADVKIFGTREGKRKEEWMERRRVAGPRLLSASQDGTVRVWRKMPRRKDAPSSSKWSTIIVETREEWMEEGRLPEEHVRGVYCAAWSQRTGRVVTTGADGRVVVYEETWKEGEEEEGTEWKTITKLDGAHGVYEANHVAWARRADRGKEEGREEEVVVSTGDDGEVKVWKLQL